MRAQLAYWTLLGGMGSAKFVCWRACLLAGLFAGGLVCWRACLPAGFSAGVLACSYAGRLKCWQTCALSGVRAAGGVCVCRFAYMSSQLGSIAAILSAMRASEAALATMPTATCGNYGTLFK
eukprot:5777346-Pleurochrysis_carterae.AAC.2